MGYAYITSTAATVVETDRVAKAAIQFNQSFTGSVTLWDLAATSSAASNLAIIGPSAAGARYEYWDLGQGFVVKASAACDVTAMTSGSYGMQ